MANVWVSRKKGSSSYYFAGTLHSHSPFDCIWVATQKRSSMSWGEIEVHFLLAVKRRELNLNWTSKTKYSSGVSPLTFQTLTSYMNVTEGYVRLTQCLSIAGWPWHEHLPLCPAPVHLPWRLRIHPTELRLRVWRFDPQPDAALLNPVQEHPRGSNVNSRRTENDKGIIYFHFIFDHRVPKNWRYFLIYGLYHLRPLFSRSHHRSICG